MPKRKKRRGPHNVPWTADETNLIMLHYGHMTIKELRQAHLPDRTVVAIQQKAYKMGLCDTPDVLTEQEIEIIKKYAEQGISIREIRNTYLPDRGYKQVSKKAQQLGYGRKPAPPSTPKTPNEPWTARETDILKTHYGTMSAYELHEKHLPRRNVSAIINKAYSIGLSDPDRDRDGWTRDELELLKKYAGTMPPSRIHELYLPGKTAKRISNKMHVLGIKPLRGKTPWSKEDLLKLKQFYGNVTPDCLNGLFPGRTPHSLKNGHRRLIYIRPVEPGYDRAERNRSDPPRLRYSRLREADAVMPGLVCPACGKPITVGEPILICPLCASVFHASCRDAAETHFKAHGE